MTGLEIGLLAAIVVVILLAVVFLTWRRTRLRRRLQASEFALATLSEELASAPVDLRKVLGDGARQLITVEILNPLEVASGESRFAKHLGGVASTMIRREVTKRTAVELTAQLQERGIDAEVRVHDAG